MGTLTATGQAAFYAGAFACVSGIACTSINVWYNQQRDLRQALKEDKDRNDRNTERDADRVAQKLKEDANRVAQKLKEDADRAAKYADREAQRKHEREKWTREEKKNTWFGK